MSPKPLQTSRSSRRDRRSIRSFLDILVCPLSKSTLRYDRERQELISDQAGLAYPIRDGIPIMLVDEARTLGEDEAIPDAVKADPRADR